MKIVKSFEDSGFLLKGVSDIIQSEAKEAKKQRGGFLTMLLGTIGGSLSGNMLAGKGMNREGEEITKAGYRSQFFWKIIPSYLLTNFEIQKYYQNKSRFNGIYSRDNLPKKIKDGAYVINLDKYYDIGTHWIAFYVLNNNVTYFDSFGVEHISNETEKFINGFTIKTNIYRMQAYDSVMCGCFCI